MTKVADANLAISIIVLNVNGLNNSIKKTEIDCIKRTYTNTRSKCILFIRTCLLLKDASKLKIKG